MAVDLRTRIGNVELPNPVIVGAGCHSRDAATMKKLAATGVAAFATKTIVAQPAPDVLPCFTTVRGGFINSVFGSTVPPEQWFDVEIPRAKEAGLTVIANLAGVTPEETAQLAVRAEKAGADIIELPTVCSHMKEILEAMFPGLTIPMPAINDPAPFVTTLRAVKAAVKVPVVAKLSAVFLNNTVQWAEAAKAGGADAVACCDALGPALAIDVRTGQPLLGGPRGVGGLTGDALKPIALRMTLEVGMSTGLPVIGVGGISRAEDAVEYIMAGAWAVGVVTAGHLKGPAAYSRLISDLARFMEERGYSSLADFRGLTIRKIQERQAAGTACITQPRPPEIDGDRCNGCGLCVTSCVYEAMRPGKPVTCDVAVCYGCGLCARVCPRGAITFSYYR